MKLTAKRFCDRCKRMKECSTRYVIENSFVDNVTELKCFQSCNAKYDVVSGIELYVYENGIAIINDWYWAKQLGLKQEYMPHEELKELVKKRVEANTGWQFRG
jgi:hypothetical protein